MPGSVVQFKQLAQNTNTTPASITLDAPATAGNMLVVVYGGDDYVTLANRPSGFTEPTGARQETFLGHYAWIKTATGGETTFTATPGSAVPWCLIALEVSGVSALDISNGQLTATSATNYSTPTVTPGAGPKFGVATIGGSANVAFPGGVGAWTNGFTEVADVATTLASGTRDNISVATLSFTASGSSTIDTNATWDSAFTPQSRTSIILVFTETGGGGPAPVWAPHQLRPPGRVSPGAAHWQPWTGDPSVTGATATNATEAVGTGTASDAAIAVEAQSEQPNGNGSAPDAAASVAPNATEAVGTGGAFDATVTAVSSSSPTATEALGAGSAFDATVSITITPAEGAGTGSALGASVSLGIGAGTGTGAGTAEWDAGSSVSLDLVADGPVDGVGTAYDATISTAAATSANATEAVGAGSAASAAVAVTINAEQPTGAGSALDATVSTATSSTAPATEALGAGSALDAQVTVTVNAGAATGAGTANDATVSTAAQASANAVEAIAAGSALDATVSVGTPATEAVGAGSAFNATVQTGTVTAATEALGAGGAFDASVAVTFSALEAVASGATDSSASVGVPAGIASASGAGYSAGADIGGLALIALASGQAFNATILGLSNIVVPGGTGVRVTGDELATTITGPE